MPKKGSKKGGVPTKGKIKEALKPHGRPSEAHIRDVQMALRIEDECGKIKNEDNKIECASRIINNVKRGRKAAAARKKKGGKKKGGKKKGAKKGGSMKGKGKGKKK